ncbi:hypothetical protein FisN_8Lh122 [Fistulifera solaris]|uniref:Phospholipid/glycerol acyltransferase domain-containing protein n=1 Tax=Fistulifera solaris TaxID=1519565 RepID=A0A1Z5JDE7_FISSO|nr:hypothetical protein FisN_8Lh122 [Fistulifera solaris]|eukprot:GAX12024.1 hypothetical protein FisN_8Lh122 [Fistulifera solaris]
MKFHYSFFLLCSFACPVNAFAIPKFRSVSFRQQQTVSKDQIIKKHEAVLNASTAINGATATKTAFFPQVKKTLRQIGMCLYIVAMCLALPLTLLPQQILYRLKLINEKQLHNWAVPTAAFCSRWLMKLIPFCKLQVQHYGAIPTIDEPRIWVCNHTSLLDVFLLLAAHSQLKMNGRRMTIMYWKQLEDHLVTRIFFRQAGFIPVGMAANGHGTPNEYDKQSFKAMLVACKNALNSGCDLGILPEGQCNPTPENGLLEVFTGAFSMARKTTPIQMIAMHGAHKVWHPIDGVVGETDKVSVMVYHPARVYKDPRDFTMTFSTVVGKYGASGKNVADLDDWLSGKAYEKVVAVEESETKHVANDRRDVTQNTQLLQEDSSKQQVEVEFQQREESSFE